MKNWIIILLIFVLPISFYSYFDAQAQMQSVCKVEGNAEIKNPKAKIIKFSSPMCSECKEMEVELKAATNNWTKDKFECWVKYRSEWFDSRDILSQHYETVEDFGFDEGLYGLYATRPSIYESIDDLNEAFSSKDIIL